MVGEIEMTMVELEAIAKEKGVAVYVVLDQIVLDATVGKN